MPGITTVCRWWFSALLIGLLLNTSSFVKVLASSNDYSNNFLNQNAGDNPGDPQEQDADHAVAGGSASRWPELIPAADSERHSFAQALPQEFDNQHFGMFTFTGGFSSFDGVDGFRNFDFSMTQSSDPQYRDVALDTFNHRVAEASELCASDRLVPLHGQSSASEYPDIPEQPQEPPHAVHDMHDTQFHFNELSHLYQQPVTEAEELWASDQQVPLHGQSSASEHQDIQVSQQPQEPPHAVHDMHDTQFHFNELSHLYQQPVTEAEEFWASDQQVPLHGQSSASEHQDIQVSQQPQEPPHAVHDMHDTQSHFNELSHLYQQPVIEAEELWASDQQVPLHGQSSASEHQDIQVSQQPQEPPQAQVLQGMYDIQLHFNELPYSESHDWSHEAPVDPPTRLDPDYSSSNTYYPHQHPRRRRSPSPPLTSSAQDRRPQKRRRGLEEESNEPGPGLAYLNDQRLPYDGHLLDTRWATIRQRGGLPGTGGRMAPEQGTHVGWETRAQGGITHAGQQNRPPAQAQAQQAQDNEARMQSLYRGHHGFGLPSRANSLSEELRRLFRAINSDQEIMSATHNEWIGPEERQHRANFLAAAVNVADEVIRDTLPLSHPLRQAFLSGNQEHIAARVIELLDHDGFAHIQSLDGSDPQNLSPAEGGRQVQNWRRDRDSGLRTSSAQSVALPSFGRPIRLDENGHYALPGQEVRTVHPTLEISTPGMLYLHYVSPLVGNMVERLLCLFPSESTRGYRSFDSVNLAMPTLGLGWITLATVLLRQALLRYLPGYGIGYWMLLSEDERNEDLAFAIEEQFLWRTSVLDWIFTQTDEYYSIVGFLSSLRTRVLAATNKTMKVEGQRRRYPQIYHPTGHTGLMRGPPGTVGGEESEDVRPGPDEAGPSRPRQQPYRVGEIVDSEATGSKPRRRPKQASAPRSSGPSFESQNNQGKGKGKGKEDAPPPAEDENGKN